MKTKKTSNAHSRGLKVLERTALASASAGANSACMFIFHNPKKPEALNKLKKF